MAIALPHQHPKFWFDDGNLILCIDDHVFRVHQELLYRHSRSLAAWTANVAPADYGITATDADNCTIVYVPDSVQVKVGDVVALLEHLYHDA